MKLNKEITKLMSKEYQVLWALSKESYILDSSIRRMLTDSVKRARQKYLNKLGDDLLNRKLEKFGNNGNWGINKIKELSKYVYQDKSPGMVDLGQWISVEIELVMPDKKAENSFVQFIRKNDFQKFVTLKDDGSVKVKKCDCEEYFDDDLDEHVTNHDNDCQADGNHAFGKEIILTFKSGNWDFVRVICDKLNSLHVTVNKTCGLHVHFDMRHMASGRKMAVVAQRIAKAVPALKQMLPASRQDNEYCAKIINKLSDSDHSHRSRYCFVNLKAYEKHKTLEIRGHSGTTDAIKIINWIKMIQVIMAKPNRSEISTVQGLIAKFNFEGDLQVYMLARQAKFTNIARPQTDDVSNDNRFSETGQAELFSIGSTPHEISVSQDILDASRYAYNVTANGQVYRLDESQLREALDIQNIEPLLSTLQQPPVSERESNVA